jgi:hypothetical protein
MHQNQIEQNVTGTCSVSVDPDDEGGRPLKVSF